MESSQFRVIIVGGSIAGLTLAHGLEKLGIEYVVLEKRANIAPQEGASIGIMPNGGRILEQLGLFDAIEQQVEPLNTAYLYWSDGFSFGSRAPKIVHERFGFPFAFLERQKLLTILHSSLPEKSRIYLNKIVVRLEQRDNGYVRVHTQDGCSYEGDLVVGADGVHSRVRTEMWKMADALRPGLVTVQEKKSQTVEYACTYGISSSVPGLKIGHHVTRLGDGFCIQTFPGKNGLVYWFLIDKLDRKYSYANAPRFSSDHADNRCNQLSEHKVWKNIKFGEVWKKRQVVSKTAIEENVFKTWHFGRIVCIGDSMHKMAPNTGQGANCAIEDAASLLNVLHNVLKTKINAGKPSDQEIDICLNKFAEIRIPRMHKLYKSAKLLVRMHARDGLFMALFGRYYVPRSGDVAAEKASETVVDAVRLDFLPLPKRSGPGWDTFSSKKRSFKPHIVAALVLMLMSALVHLGAILVPLLSHRLEGFRISYITA